MFNVKFAELAPTANRFSLDHMHVGHIVKFDIIQNYDGKGELAILLEDSNNDGGRHYPYTIRFNVKVERAGTMTFTPKTNKRFDVEMGTVLRDEVIYQFQRRLFRQMALKF